MHWTELLLLVVIVPCVTLDYCTEKAGRHPLTPVHHHPVNLLIGGFFPSTPLPDSASVQNLKASIMPAVSLAVSHVHRHDCVLKGYRLLIEERDSRCKASVGTKAFFDLMQTSPEIVAMYGDACTAVNQPVALTTKYWNMVQLSYAETHPMFEAEDSVEFGEGTIKKTYGAFYRMVPAAWNMHHARFAFLSFFNWTRVGTLKQSDDPRYALPHEAFTTQLHRKLHIKVVTTAEISSEKLNLTQALLTLKSHDARIIVAYFNMSFARLIFCEAYRLGMYGPNYVWLVPGYGPQGLIKTTNNNLPVKCTERQILTAMHGHFSMGAEVTRDDDTMLISDMDVYSYLNEYEALCSRTRECDSNNQYHGYAYDGVWALSLALDKVIDQLSSADAYFTPAVLQNEQERINFTEHLLGALEKTHFEGVTGKVDFLDNSRLGKIQISMFMTEPDGNGSYIKIGSYDGANQSFSLQLSALNDSGWRAPLDRTEQVNVPQRVHRVLYFTFCVLAVLGMLLGLVFLSVNVYFRDHKLIRMSSPNMNNLIIAGSLLTYLSVIFLGLDTSFVSDQGFTVICNAKVWVLCLGFTLAFGSMFSKTWRVHSIFTNIKLNKKAIRDYKLFLIVGVLVLIDIVLLSAWLIVSPMTKRTIHLVPKLDEVNNRKLVPEIEQCHSDKAAIFQGLIYGNKGLLMVLGCFLAWETRHVNVPALNDSKYIGMSVYNVVLMCIIGLALSFILSTQVNESYLVTSTFIIFCTTLTLCLVFVPKIVQLIRNPKNAGRRYRPGMMKTVLNRNADQRRSSLLSQDDAKDNLMRSEQDNQVWHQLLDEKIKEITDIIAQLREYGDFIEDATVKDSMIESSSTVPEDPFGGVWLGGHSPAQPPAATLAQSPTSRRPVQDANETTLLLAPRNGGNRRQNPSVFAGGISTKLRASKKRVSSDLSSGAPPEDPNGHSAVVLYPPFKAVEHLHKMPKTSKSIDRNLLNLTNGAGSEKSNSGVYCSLPDLSTSPELSHSFELTTFTTSEGITWKNGGCKGDVSDSEEEEEDGLPFNPGIPHAMRFIDSILSDDVVNSGINKALPGRDGTDDPALQLLLHSNSDEDSDYEYL